MYFCGMALLLLAGFLAYTSIRSDIQIGIVVTAVVGGVVCLGIGRILARLEDGHVGKQ